MDEGKNSVPVLDWTALLAYLMVGAAVIMMLSFGIDLLAKRFGFTALVELGRRRDLGFIIALLLGLPLTHLIARALGLAPRQAKQDGSRR